jgi:hypothetical protein
VLPSSTAPRFFVNKDETERKKVVINILPDGFTPCFNKKYKLALDYFGWAGLVWVYIKLRESPPYH